MYNQFCENFRCFLKYHSNNLCKNEDQLSLLEPFYGLCNYETYENWKLRSDLRYYETSNLIYYMSNISNKYPAIYHFYSELCDIGYDCQQNEDFDDEKLEEQIKLINILLGPKFSKSIV